MKTVISFICALFVLFLIATCYGLQQSEQCEYISKDDMTNVFSVVEMESTTIIRDGQTDDLLPAPIIHKPETILRRKAYMLSYNTDTKMANWVAWKLTAEHTDGPFPRKGVPYYDDEGNAIGIASFSADVVRGDYFVDMEAPVPRQEHSDWKERPSGIDHGHICPAADCKWDKGAMNQSFLLTNMCPQDHDLNGGDWDRLENKCRMWAKRYGEIYIVAGPVFADSLKHCFGANKIPIPDAFFKVVLCMAETPKALGFIFPNDGTHRELKDCVSTIDKVEEITGIDFFPTLPDSIEYAIEENAVISSW